jgi:hypothetical protein
MKPEFVDNRNGNTLLSALRGHIEWLGDTYAQPVELSIATGYFNPEGFSLLADHLDSMAHVRLMLGAEPVPPSARPRREPGDPRGKQYNARLVEGALASMEEGLAHDRDLLGFTADVDANVQRLLDFLESGKVEVRRYERSFLHGKAFIFADEEGVIAGSSNFTAAGLTSNLELNLGRYDPAPVRAVKKWFDDLWAESVPYDLSNLYAARYVEYEPYLIYLRVLWELYGAELEEEHAEDAGIHLTGFQEDGLWRAKQILERYNGAVVADGVGLGKTYIAGELLRETIEERRQRALLISPATLRDGTWDRFRDKHQLYFENVSYEQLAEEEQLGGEQPYLRHQPQEYSLVVIDEAQAFRNPSTKRAYALRRLLAGSPPKQLLLLTATPVNNSLWDLYYLLNYFIGHDAVFASRGIFSLRERFKEAEATDPYDLQPDMLFDVLDATTVRRTRHFVRRYYPNDLIPGPDGTMVRIEFPRPHVHKVTYRLEEVVPSFFNTFAEALAPESDEEPGLTLARYWPSRYRIGGAPVQHEVALVGLLRSALLKRFESSVYAFGQTASRMARTNAAFLASLEAGYIPTPDLLEEWTTTDSDEAFEDLLKTSGAAPTEGYDLERLRRDVENDRRILERFAAVAQGVAPHEDPKLAALADELAKIASQAEQEALDDADARDRRKVLIFSYFADTVDWIEEYLLLIIEADPGLEAYRGRLASVTSEASRRGISREEAVFGFVPRSAEAPPSRAEDRFDILVTTDVLAEGHNLQQCRNIINYDLPWNPMRLVQRNGRIDRIGSPHSDIYLRCFFPDEELDTLLDLESRIRRKLAQAAATIGVDSEVIPEGATSEIVFAETREEIERLRREDARIFELGGEDPAAHSGEEYRQELRQGLDERGREIRQLPWAAGSGFGLGPRRGHFFCARVGEHLYLRFVPADEDTELVQDTLGCLRLITCGPTTPRHLPPSLQQGAYEAWQVARDDIYESWLYATDPMNLQPRVRPLFQEAAAHLRQYPPPALTQDELIDAIESLEAPWGIRIEKQLRAVFQVETTDPVSVSRALVEKIDELGLEPYVAPEPLPLIDRDEIQLICWMAVDTASSPT